jgi:acyl transferase domain-containing protein
MTGKRYRHIFLFTGQGAQYHGMARALYETEPVFRQWMDDLDLIPQKKITRSIVDFLYGEQNDDSSEFDRTLISHPSLFMVQFSLAKTLINYGVIPDCLMGASLGEYVSMALAGVLSPRTMLAALIDNAQILETCCRPGTMIGISDSFQRFEQHPAFYDNSSLAGIISPKQFVVSGDRPAMDRVIRHLKETKTEFQRLPMRFGFHSPNIDTAETVWKKRLSTVINKSGGLNRPNIKVVSCCTASYVMNPSINNFWDIGRAPIQFRRALRTLNEELERQEKTFGRSSEPVKIIDLGPGSYTSGFIRQNRILGKGSRVYRIMTLFGNEIRNLNKLKTELIPA